VAASLQSDSMGSVRKSKRGVRKSRAKAQTESTPDGAPSTALQHRATQAARRAMNLATSGFPSFEQLQARTGKFFARVEKKLEQVPDERRQPPPATIAAPAALQYALLGEAPEAAELREMFENLLASSMDSDTASSAHPAFVSMISQMSRDEARILKHPDAYYGEDLGLTTFVLLVPLVVILAVLTAWPAGITERSFPANQPTTFIGSQQELAP